VPYRTGVLIIVSVIRESLNTAPLNTPREAKIEPLSVTIKGDS
jgi:hypothetical protein